MQINPCHNAQEARIHVVLFGLTAAEAHAASLGLCSIQGNMVQLAGSIRIFRDKVLFFQLEFVHYLLVSQR